MLKGMHFSRRTGWESGENDWARAAQAFRETGRTLIDLTVSNPTACGLSPEADTLLAPLANAGALRYTPDPLGMRDARAAVALYYHDQEAAIPAEHMCLTTSTSEAYSFLFRLLCDPGDEVLIARPSYPLFDLLARLDDVNLREYPLLYDPVCGSSTSGAGRGSWVLDLHALETAITPRTRAVIVVHPNNPTGNYVSGADREALQQLCTRHGLALIVDEVFLDYTLNAGQGSTTPASFAVGSSPCPCFVLSGLSKICALPQMKLSWLAATGPAPLVAAAMERLEVIADTFLSVSAPTQFALPAWLAGRHPTQDHIRRRLAANLAFLDQRLMGTSASRLGMEGGWTAVLRVPSTVDGEEFALAAIERGVLVQPGSFYGLPAGRCVLSLLTPPEIWQQGLPRLPIG